MTKRILVVEDQEDLRGVLRDLLTGSGYNVAEAADGRDGVAKTLSERPDLILMDIQLPGLDGYETTRQIRQLKSDPKLATTPIIAVSSFADGRRAVVHQGADGYCGGRSGEASRVSRRSWLGEGLIALERAFLRAGPRQYAAQPEYCTTSCPEKSNSLAKKDRLCQRILERERCSAQIR